MIIKMVVNTHYTQTKGRPSFHVDLVYVFWTVQTLEPIPYRFGVTPHRGVHEALVQDHLARIGFTVLIKNPR